ncbi:MAG: RlmE family RNA methyltransferase [Thermodesulfobacteriota bacterium]
MAHPSRKDPFRVKAKTEGYPARSVYKLKEIQDKYHIIKPGQRIIDFGCHPGSWLKFCSQAVGTEGRVLGVDLKRPLVPLSPNIFFLQGDIQSLIPESFKEWAGRADVVLSDLAPNTCGIKWLDQQRSLELNNRALDLGEYLLKKGGTAVLKIFEGPETGNVIQRMKNGFFQIHIHKPKSSRAESPEIYLIGQGFMRPIN